MAQKMDRYRDIEKALEEVRSKKLSIRAASKKYQIPKSNLSDHVCGKHPGKHGARTVFNEEEEAIICANLAKVSEWGFPFTKFDLRILAKQYLDKAGRSEPRFKNNLPGEEWVEGFLRRNAELSLRTCRNIPVRRSKVRVRSIILIFSANVDYFVFFKFSSKTSVHVYRLILSNANNILNS